MISTYATLGLLLGTLMTAPLCAALPPLYETLKEYQALLASPEFTQKLTSADVIEDIKRENQSFLIKTNKHNLKVDIVYDAQSRPGPSKFHFVFHDAESVEQ